MSKLNEKIPKRIISIEKKRTSIYNSYYESKQILRERRSINHMIAKLLQMGIQTGSKCVGKNPKSSTIGAVIGAAVVCALTGPFGLLSGSLVGVCLGGLAGEAGLEKRLGK